MEKRRKTLSSQSSVSRSRKKSRMSRRRTTHTYQEIPGLFQVNISPSLQSVLSCRIGINITNDERWVYVDKQKLISELKFRKHSGFSGIITELNEFPEDDILVGSYGGDDFLVCLSEYAKNVCENWMEQEKKMLREGLLRLLSKDTFHWTPLGSDEEIDENIANRRPFCINLQLKIGFSIKFDLRLPNDCKDGYVEFVDTRTNYNILLRKRLDKACQVGNLMLNKLCQTVAPASTHRGIQYKYTYPQINESKDFKLRINAWLQQCYNDLKIILLFNASVDIYKNDYWNLPDQKTRHKIENPNLIIPFYDTICHGKVVNCIAWNSSYSGIIAAAYGISCPKIKVKKQSKHPDYSYRKLIDENLVLLWDASNPKKPLFYLHADREITAMNFCPYNPNILIGGCLNGQIVVWDLNGKLDQKPETKIQTTEVLMLIKDKMSWMKYPPDDHHIFPCVISKFETCHKSHITEIKWIPPEYHINKQGEIVECENNDEHMHFLTTAIDDGTLLVWDLALKNKPSLFQQPKKRKKELPFKRPKALDEKKSPYSKLNSNFKPKFRLNLIDSETKGIIYVNDFSFKMGAFCYKPLNNENIGDISQRTTFIRDKEMENFTLEKNLLIASVFGKLYNCSWSSHSFDQGLKVNWQNIDSVSFSSYHDGPIYHIRRNPCQPDIVLITGGRVFSIWDNSSANKKPLIWRKGLVRYVTAVWGSENPLAVIAAREDSKIELWDFDEDSKFPLRMTKLIGDQLLSVFATNSLNHVMKNTCLTTDLSGTLSIYSTPAKLFVSNKASINTRHNNIKSINYRRDLLKYWNDYVKRKRENVVEDQESDIKEEDILKEQSRQSIHRKGSTLQKTLSLRTIQCNKWKSKEFTRMYNILIEKHKMNLNDLEMNKGPCKEIVKGQAARQNQIDKYIANKEIIYQEERVKLLHKNKQETYFAPHFPKEIKNEIKQEYLESYRHIEADTKKYIENHQYRYFFDYQAMITDAKRQYSVFLSTQSSMFSQDTRDYSNNIPQVGTKSTNIIVTEFALQM